LNGLFASGENGALGAGLSDGEARERYGVACFDGEHFGLELLDAFLVTGGICGDCQLTDLYLEGDFPTADATERAGDGGDLEHGTDGRAARFRLSDGEPKRVSVEQ
jgi:hypothetical protein